VFTAAAHASEAAQQESTTVIDQFRTPRVLWAPRDSGWWVAATFIVGSVLFMVGAVLPVWPDVPDEAIELIYFIGSGLYLAGAAIQVIKGRRQRLSEEFGPKLLKSFANRNSLAASIQGFGALLFQTSMTSALFPNLTIGEQQAAVWAPDLIGSLCFVTASSIFYSLRHPIQHRIDDPRDARFLAFLNILGSSLFVASAVGAYVVTASGSDLNPALANIGTLIGALFFLLSSIPGLPPRRR
jgi:hypothetical protein